MVAIDLITEHIRMKLQQPDLRRIHHNLEVIPSNYQTRGALSDALLCVGRCQGSDGMCSPAALWRVLRLVTRGSSHAGTLYGGRRAGCCRDAHHHQEPRHDYERLCVLCGPPPPPGARGPDSLSVPDHMQRPSFWGRSTCAASQQLPTRLPSGAALQHRDLPRLAQPAVCADAEVPLRAQVVEAGLGHLPFAERTVITPTGRPYVGVDFAKRLCGVSIIRSGESMENALRGCCQGIKIGKILVHRCAAAGGCLC